MRLVASHGLRHAVNSPSLPLLQAAVPGQLRSINTKPRHERPQAIVEQLNLRLQPNPRAKSIGILGGGITGLTTAWHLSRFIPDAKITIYERKNRVGGWLESEIVDTDEGQVLFEWGPRSLRPDPAGAGRATILLMLQLKLQESLIGIKKTAPAALNRFLYYDGHLVLMPGPNPNRPLFWNAIRNGYKVLTEPIFNGLIGSIFAENWVQSRPADMADESVGHFIRRRFGKTAADNLASAFFHGIYAGDLYKLSARTLLPALWHMETRDPEGAGILMEMTDIAFKGHGLMQYKHGRYVDLLEAAADHDSSATVRFLQDMHSEMSVYSFDHGLQTLGNRLEEKLRERSNISIQTNVTVESLQHDKVSKKTKILTNQSKDTPDEHDYIVATLSPSTFLDSSSSNTNSDSVSSSNAQEQAIIDSSHSVNVGVVNLYYSNPDLIPSTYQGFGYLIPRTVSTDENPERALGVIFGSETSGVRGKQAVQTIDNPIKESIRAMEHFLKTMTPEGLSEEQQKLFDKHAAAQKEKLQEQKAKAESEPDQITMRFGQDTAPGTKLTVMLGGHWWDSWLDSDLPSEDKLIDMAKSVVARHLKIMENPLVAKARMNRDAIPQYHVGYRQRMASIHRLLMDKYQGRVKVAGPWYQAGVGVNDCIMSAHMTAFNIREEWDDETGLKDYTEKEKWLVCDRRTQTFTLDGK